MPRARCLWVSTVITLGTQGAEQRVPATYLAQADLARRNVQPFYCHFAAPGMTGPQAFVGLAEMSATEQELTAHYAALRGAQVLLYEHDARTGFGALDRAPSDRERATLAAVFGDDAIPHGSLRAILRDLVRALAPAERSGPVHIALAE